MVPRFSQRPTDSGSHTSTSRPAANRHGLHVHPDFEAEFPGSNAFASEIIGTMIVAADLIQDRIQRHLDAAIGLTEPVFEALTVLDGAGRPLTPSQISERTVKSSATTTSTLDTLERRGFIRRTPNPNDRRSLLIEITEDGRTATDKALPIVHHCEAELLDGVANEDLQSLRDALYGIVTRVNELNAAKIDLNAAERVRPIHLN